MTVDFEKFPKIARLKGLRMTITEKIDGTNAQIVVHDSNYEPGGSDPVGPEPIQVGSRNRWIVPEKGKDNYDFARWAYENAEMLQRLGPGRHFGEWWGVGIARKYNITERRWSLFNVHRFADGLPEGLPANVGLVPVLYQGDFSMAQVEASKELLAREGSRAAPGFMKPEGIVVRVENTGGPAIVWKWTFDGDGKQEPSPEEVVAA